ncbi:SBBP repeat-containing protein [Methanospirillum sp. J.3.6.1-F.2.7.3]|uniref:SBBP repeat-containing protein n=1 Tax=Methanospirillum purgamenti TaxID=2834276 RepID=A0A8E7B179_9EURY|nr:MULTISPECIES: SBBP repeat-containing protein [Methanospirillum]MDX8551790.1 SBBP repeat-containing protein [Methanospirillum hungatei]QVV89186.1 SBBP repeat-containing protein [Methanospirillum sp. J.3.6.1-F.2.7.3]
MFLVQCVNAGYISGTISGEPVLFTNTENQTLSINESINKTVKAQLASLPLSFIPNEGQTDPTVRFMVKGSGTSFSFTKSGMLFSMQGPPDITNTSFVVTQTFIGANESVHIAGEDLLPGTANFFIGDDLDNWRSNITTYGTVRYHDLYPGIDLLYRGNGSVLKREFIVAPGVDPEFIRMKYTGAESLSIDSFGNLNITSVPGSMIESQPVCFQEIDGNRVDIGARYILTGSDELSIEVDEYDSAYELVIDPNLVYSTYLGGTGNEDNGAAIAVDSSGNVFVIGSVTGWASMVAFPTTPGAYQTVYGNMNDAFVTKLNPAGSSLLYSTYLGGNNADYGSGIEIDSSGNAYVTGRTASTNFPVTSGAYMQTFGGGDWDVFVTKLNSAGSSLLYSTYLGGTSHEYGEAIAVDANRNVYVTGWTRSDNFPTTAEAYQRIGTGGGWHADVFITKLNSAGSSLLYSTYLGGTESDSGHGIAVDVSGNTYITGTTDSTNFPTTIGAYQTVIGGNDDAFVTKLNSAGSSLLYSTFLGRNYNDSGNGIAVDAVGNVYVTGGTSNFPTTIGAYQTVFGGTSDAFVTKLNSAGSSLLYSTYLGGEHVESGESIGIDTAGNAYVVGGTSSSHFPVTSGAYQTVYGGVGDAFVTKLNSAGSSLLYSTYLGTESDDSGKGIAVDSSGNAYVTGYTWGSNFPTTTGAYQRTLYGYSDAFITKISFSNLIGDKIGVFRGNKWYLDYSGNGAWGTGDKTNNFGLSGDKPVTGDWNKDGKTKIGVFRGNKWYLDYNGNGVWNGPSTDRQYTFGLSGDKPVTGDWNKDGKTKIGVFRGNKWYLDYNGNGAWNGPSTDRQYTFGLSGDTPVTGDWNGDGKTDIGVFRGNKWYLDYNGNGVWNGPSTDRQYTFGLSGDTPVTGDWNGDGKTDIGVFRGNKWYLDSSGNGAWGTGDKTYTFGLSGDTPVTGKWSGSSGTASIQSVELNPVTKPDSAFKVPDVTRPVAAVPKVEMPVKSNPDLKNIAPKGIYSIPNPLALRTGQIPGNPLI